VAICRLKRVAADHKDDVRARLPKPATQKNGKRIACVGAGPASLTVARDLAPLGYEVTVFEADPKGGGFMRTQVPRFRLPESVIDEEVGYILAWAPISAAAADRFDEGPAGAGLRRRLRRVRRAARTRSRAARPPRGRRAHPHRHRLAGLGVLRSCHKVGQRVIVLGGGNTAMDCCRSARRLGGADVKVIVRSGFDEMKASPWEKEDAMHEASRSSTTWCPSPSHENGKLTGMWFEGAAERDAKGRRSLVPTGEPDEFACDEVLVAVGQENAFPWIERDAGIEFDRWGMPVDPKLTHQSSGRRCSSAATRRSARRTSSGPWRTATRPRSRSTSCSPARTSRSDSRAAGAVSQKMGIHEWSYDNDITARRATRCRGRRRKGPGQHPDGSRARLRPASSRGRKRSAA
jgi:formate dehydrogenase beta subunit